MSTLAARLRAHVGLKAAGAVAYAATLPVYLAVQRAAAPRATLQPWTPLERAVPATALALGPYLANLVLSGMPFLLIGSAERWRRAALGMAMLLAVGWAIQLAAPLTLARPPLDGAAIAGLRAIDGPGNAYPSLHAATAVFASRLWLGEERPRAARVAATWAWTALVAWSCVALRQHTALDLVAGGALGWGAAAAVGVDRPEAA